MKGKLMQSITGRSVRRLAADMRRGPETSAQSAAIDDLERLAAQLDARDGLCHAPGPRWTPGSRCTRKAGHKGAHRADSHVIWSPDDRPRLVITSNHPDDGWWWQLVNREGYGRGSAAPTQPAALALGLAALDTTRTGAPHGR